MTTTITPSLGQGALFTQGGAGLSPGYSAIDLRRAATLGMQEGVLNASDFMVVQRAAGANMSVDVGMPAGGMAYVQGDSVSGQAIYPVPVHSATINETITAANATNPRVDQVILELQDNTHDASGASSARIRVVAGTATAGATLTNRTGAAALPSSALLLADVLVGAAVGSISNTVIRDRRKWARGAYNRIVRTSADYTTVGTSLALVDATNLQPRIECSGAPVRITLRCRHVNSGGNSNGYNAFLDGAAAESGSTDMFLRLMAAAADEILHLSWDLVPAAGSHLIGWAWRVSAGTGTLRAGTTTPLEMTVEEFVRQNTANNATTSG